VNQSWLVGVQGDFTFADITGNGALVAATLGLALMAVVGLAPAPASAEVGNMTHFRYEACTCTFGYPGNACVTAVSCMSEGGHCSGSCHREGKSSPALRVRG